METMTTAPAMSVTVSPLLSLALLEAVQGVDAHVPDELDEVHQELAVKRLGRSATVQVQIDRLRRQARRGAPATAEEFAALLTLVGRRRDAGLVFTDAGRRLGRRLIDDLPVPTGLARLAGWSIARRRLRQYLGVVLTTAEPAAGELAGDLLVRATPDGAACAFVGAAVAEMLRSLTSFDGAMIHVACRARGDDVCRWRAR
jgi:predicted hydrocarbon binding protein